MKGSGRVRLSSAAEALRPDVEVPPGFMAGPTEVVEDRRLSAKALGIVWYLYSFESGRAFSIAELVAAGPDGRDSVLTGLRELVECGYIDPLYIKARIPPELRMAVLRRDGYRCVWSATPTRI